MEKGLGMDISAKAVRFDDDSMWVELSDGRTIGVPYAWFPRLLTQRRSSETRLKSAVLASTGRISTRTFRLPVCSQDGATEQ